LAAAAFATAEPAARALAPPTDRPAAGFTAVVLRADFPRADPLPAAVESPGNMSAAGPVVSSSSIVSVVIAGELPNAADVRRGVTGRRPATGLAAVGRAAVGRVAIVRPGLTAAGLPATGLVAVDLPATVLFADPVTVLFAGPVTVLFAGPATVRAADVERPATTPVRPVPVIELSVVEVRAAGAVRVARDDALTGAPGGVPAVPALVARVVGAFLAAAIWVFLLANDCGLVSAWRLRRFRLGQRSRRRC
jgi:hypothetical protein